MEGTCKHSDVCGRDALDGHDGQCILHSKQRGKSEVAFYEAYAKHLEVQGTDFRHMVFPSGFSFSDFQEKANFTEATFRECNFRDIKFAKEAIFRSATFESRLQQESRPVAPGGIASIITTSFRGSAFEEGAIFLDATFKGDVEFIDATFENGANFTDSVFEDRVYFRGTSFRGETFFSRTSFEREVLFLGVCFEKDVYFNQSIFGIPDKPLFGGGNRISSTFKERAFFSDAIFNQRTVFKQIAPKRVEFDRSRVRGTLLFGGSDEKKVFERSKVSLKHVDLSLDSTLRFRNADLSKCYFRGTDLQNIDFVGIRWCQDVNSDGWWFPEWFGRIGVFEEIEEDSRLSWPEVERTYRQLKKNHEERGDFPSGGDFHVGEKVCRRKHSWERFSSDWDQWFLLGLYRALSKYGERALPAALWLVGLFFVCGIGYLSMGASTGTVHLSSFCSFQDWWEALLLSGEATLFPVRSAGFESIGPRALNLVQRGFSPILIALLALALRQRVKR